MDKADKDRVEGRKWAEDVLAAMGDTTPAYRLGFWRRMKRELHPQEIDSKAMTDREARTFGRSIVEFGKHRGLRVDDVPLEYWEWLADENSKVQRYLRSKRITRERLSE